VHGQSRQAGRGESKWHLLRAVQPPTRPPAKPHPPFHYIAAPSRLPLSPSVLQVGYVQSRWVFTNPQESYLTKAQEVSLNYHMKCEQYSHSAARSFFNFNGTAGERGEAGCGASPVCWHHCEECGRGRGLPAFK
jgi:hypothetical protein